MDEYVQEKVNGPGTAMLVFGVLTVLGGIGYGLYATVSYGAVLAASGFDPEIMVTLASSLVSSSYTTLAMLVSGVVIALGGSKLRSAEGATLVHVGAVLSILPCCSGACCCLGLPIGIWAILTMQDDQVKAAFS